MKFDKHEGGSTAIYFGKGETKPENGIFSVFLSGMEQDS